MAEPRHRSRHRTEHARDLFPGATARAGLESDPDRRARARAIAAGLMAGLGLAR